MKKINSMIINAEINNIKNQKTGEVKQYTKVVYTIERENTTERKGPAILECWIPKNCVDSLTQYLMKPTQMELEERFEKNGYRLVISKINNNAI